MKELTVLCSILIHFASGMTYNECVDGGINKQLYGSTCYQFVLDTKTTYEHARDACVKQGGLLAMVKTRDVNQFLYHTLKEVFRFSSTAWIGLQDKQKENNYVWADGSPLDTSVYSNWGAREGGAGGVHLEHYSEDCAVIDAGKPGGPWEDKKCHAAFLDFVPVIGGYQYHPYICQFVVESTPAPSMPTTRAPTPATQTEPQTPMVAVTSQPMTSQPVTSQPMLSRPAEVMTSSPETTTTATTSATATAKPSSGIVDTDMFLLGGNPQAATQTPKAPVSDVPLQIIG